MSADLCWQIIRDNHAHLLKKRNVKKPFSTNKPGKNLVKTTIKAGPRRALNSIRRFIKFNHYRKDLKKAALRRASAILRSQRAQPFKKARRRTHKVAKKTTE
ncbi:60S ribosomal protein L28-like [Homarus americanus]|uniref:Large ribosomal subunit protein eL28 n=1 Tax=Homarus americanus TaxID=6706 RepID=A0A8J5T1Y5_HOMAM|nr:60S ribosomal protein L28-like [Homarus americanus]